MYYTYIIRCKDDTLYTGITTDIERRMNEHSEGGIKSAKYTRTHGFLSVEAVWCSKNRSMASRLEYRIKRLSREKKLLLISDKKSIENIFGTDFSADYRKVSISV